MTFLLTLFASTAQAEINGADTLDLLWWDSDVVLVGTLLEGSVSVEPVDVLRGSLPAGTASFQPSNACRSPKVDPGEQVLLFLRWQDEALVPRCNLTGLGVWMVSMQHPTQLYTPAGQALETARTIHGHLSQVRSQAMVRRPEVAPSRHLFGPGALALSADHESDAFRELYSGSTVYLRVPAYPSLRVTVFERSRSEHPSTRARAAQHLSEYAGPEVQARLLSLLKDPEAQVREAARSSLRVLGVRAGALDLGVGFVDAPEGSTFTLGGIDSALGRIKTPNGLLVHFDIGKMAGTRVHDPETASCAASEAFGNGHRSCRWQKNEGRLEITWNTIGATRAYPANFMATPKTARDEAELRAIAASFTPRDSHLVFPTYVPRGLEVRTTGNQSRAGLSMEADPVSLAVSIDRVLGNRIRWRTPTGWTEPEVRCGTEFQYILGPEVAPGASPPEAELVIFETEEPCAVPWSPTDGYRELHRVYLDG